MQERGLEHPEHTSAWRRVKPPTEAILLAMDRSTNEKADDGACFSIRNSEA